VRPLYPTLTTAEIVARVGYRLIEFPYPFSFKEEEEESDMILTPMKCKICSKVISPPDQALIIGEPVQVRNQKILQRLYSHITDRMQAEQKQPSKPHTEALLQATLAGENLKGALLVGCFEISADMEAERQSVLKRVHGMTRTVRMSDEDLSQLGESADLLNGSEWGQAFALLQNLRDRYEGLGKYAPAKKQPEEVTQ